MASKPADNQGKQQEVLEGLQKAGTLKRSTVVHVSPASSKELSVQVTDTNDDPSSGWRPLSLEEKRVVLKDNTQIIVESQNEFMFIGPSTVKIVLSCLPLFCLPDKGSDSPLAIKKPHPSNFESNLPSSSAPKNNGWISFSQSNLETQNSETPPLSPKLASSPPKLGEVEEVSNIPLDEELPGDIFTLIDPFETNGVTGFSDLEVSSRSQQIDDAFEKATRTDKKSVEEDDRDCSDSDDNTVNEDTIHINYVPDVRVLKSRAASISFVTPHKIMKSGTLTASPLPPPPLTVFPRYTERGGWMIKLSHQKGVFGDRWQKRYFILNGPKLSYFKKYGDSQPRGVIQLIPGSWCRNIPLGAPRMFDAVAKTTRSGVISVNRCLAVHKPSNYAATLSALVASEGMADAFNSQTVALSNPQDSSRTFYMIASSEEERHSWVEAITNNINGYSRSQQALDIACGELGNVLKAVGSSVPDEQLPSILLAVHSRKAAALAGYHDISIAP